MADEKKGPEHFGWSPWVENGMVQSNTFFGCLHVLHGKLTCSLVTDENVRLDPSNQAQLQRGEDGGNMMEHGIHTFAPGVLFQKILARSLLW